MADRTYRPGETVPVTGNYRLVGPRGGSREKSVNLDRGTKFPPTPRPDMGWQLA